MLIFTLLCYMVPSLLMGLFELDIKGLESQHGEMLVIGIDCCQFHHITSSNKIIRFISNIYVPQKFRIPTIMSNKGFKGFLFKRLLIIWNFFFLYLRKSYLGNNYILIILNLLIFKKKLDISWNIQQLLIIMQGSTMSASELRNLNLKDGLTTPIMLGNWTTHSSLHQLLKNMLWQSILECGDFSFCGKILPFFHISKKKSYEIVKTFRGFGHIISSFHPLKSSTYLSIVSRSISKLNKSYNN